VSLNIGVETNVNRAIVLICIRSRFTRHVILDS